MRNEYFLIIEQSERIKRLEKDIEILKYIQNKCHDKTKKEGKYWQIKEAIDMQEIQMEPEVRKVIGSTPIHTRSFASISWVCS